MLTEQKSTQSKTSAPSHKSEVKHKCKYKGRIKIEDVVFITILPFSVYNVNIREKTTSNAKYKVDNEERRGEMLTLSFCNKTIHGG